MHVPLNDCTFGEDEIAAAIAVLRSGRVTMGPLCEEFENNFAGKMGVANAVFVNSGSSANLLAFFALANFALPERPGRRRPRPGMEIIVPAVTWSTTVWPIVQAGFVPVLVDCDPETLQIDVDQVRAAIGAKTCAVCPVHVLGNAVAMNELKQVTQEHGLWLIEDTCEALGTKVNDRYTGSMGDLGTYSFYFSHHITTIEGGMVVCHDDELADLLRCLRSHGWTRQMKSRGTYERQNPSIDPRFLFVNTGFNLRPTEINAAFGLKQLDKLDAFNSKRREIASRWTKDLENFAEIRPMRATRGCEPTWFGFPVLLKSQARRDALREHLETRGIETRPIICGNLARQPAFRNVPHRVHGALVGADQIMDQGLFWGSHPGMAEDAIEFVGRAVKEFFT